MTRRTNLLLAGLLVTSIASVGCRPVSAGSGDRRFGDQTGGLVSLAVHPADAALFKASGGLFRSIDGGQTWVRLPMTGTLEPEKIRQVATTAAAPESVYAAGAGTGIVRSDDHGQTWRAIGTTLPSQEVAAFAVHSVRPDTIYAAIPGQGVFQTEDDGYRWQKMDDGPPASVVALAHSTLPGSMNTGWLYAATPAGPYLSMDCF